MRLIFVLLFSLSGTFVALADIKSTSGNISFDVNSDNSSDFDLNSTGFGLGVAPSSNLHVQGNAIVESGNIAVGSDSTGTSTLSVTGTLALGVESVTGNTILSGNSMIFADTSSGNVFLTLPDAVDVVGRQYVVKKTSAQNKLIVQGGGNIDDLSEVVLEAASTGFPYVSMISSGNHQWDIVSLSGNADHVSSDNLIGWWKLDESSGNTASDSTIHGNDGTVQGTDFTTAGNTGPTNRTLIFAGDDDGISVTDNANLESLSAISVAVWAKLDSTVGNQHIVSKRNGTDDSWVLNINAGLNFTVDTGSPVSSVEASPATGEWLHIVGVWDGGNITLYINATVEDTDPQTGSMADLGYGVSIGMRANSPGNYFDGEIGEVRIYSKALSLAEIQTLYAQGQ